MEKQLHPNGLLHDATGLNWMESATEHSIVEREKPKRKVPSWAMYRDGTLREPGVIEGLTVSVDVSGNKVNIANGTAIDKNGEFVEIADTPQLGPFTFSALYKWHFIWVRYAASDSQVGSFKSGYGPADTRREDSYSLHVTVLEPGNQAMGWLPSQVFTNAYGSGQDWSWPSAPHDDCILLAACMTFNNDTVQGLIDLRQSILYGPTRHMIEVPIRVGDWRLDNGVLPSHLKASALGTQPHYETLGTCLCPFALKFETGGAEGDGHCWTTLHIPGDYEGDGHLLMPFTVGSSWVGTKLFARFFSFEMDNAKGRLDDDVDDGAAQFKETSLGSVDFSSTDWATAPDGFKVARINIPGISGIQPLSVVVVKLDWDCSGAGDPTFYDCFFRYRPKGSVFGTEYWQRCGVLTERYPKS
ncbi:MAG: hypothetical protein KAW17_09680 [Candidatus Eisenbacteria sp.]|nr:hypothetical protein [Candidatus Eisenbacteria bacterium]